MILFGTTAEGQPVHKLPLTAGSLSVDILTLGAAVQDVRLAGVPHSLTWGSDDLADYEGPMRHNGTLIGPLANRISTARVRLNGVSYELERNQADRLHLHSGKDGTHLKVWHVQGYSPDHVTLSLHLGDGVAGLPGNRNITVAYRVLENATLEMRVDATTDATTVMNFANHSFWNLDGSSDFSGHQLRIDADSYLPTDDDDAPTGEIAPTAGTTMDFTTLRPVTPNAPPLDHNFCLSQDNQLLRDVATLTGRDGVMLTVATTAPGLQIYDARHAGHKALAIEAQHWPDAPNNRRFPSIKVTPDHPYHQTTQWRFAR